MVTLINYNVIEITDITLLYITLLPFTLLINLKKKKKTDKNHRYNKVIYLK